MKKLLFALLACSLATACSLDEKILSSSTQETYYKTVEQCITGLNSCYTNIRNIYNNKEYFVVCEGQSDLLYINRSDQPNAVLMVTPSTPRFGSTMWTYCYIGVSRVNSVEAAILRSPLSDAEKAPLLAEATVLRSLFFYILTANFGDVPFYKDEVTDQTNDRISRLPRMSASDTRDILIADLHKWILEEGALDMKRTHDLSNAQYCRAGAALGLMLGGKFCLWQHRWADAVEFFSALEDIYGDLSQYPISDIPFSNRQTPESIMEISNIAVDYGLQVQGTLASICTPYRKVSSAEGEEEDDEDEQAQMVGDIYDGIGIPELGDQPFRFPCTDPRQESGKLIPARPEDQRFLWKDKAQQVGTASDIIVSGGMPAGIVHLLQVIAVRDDDAQRIGSAVFDRRQVFRIIAAVVDPGQLVGDVALPELATHLLLFGHDIDQGDDAPHPTVVIEQRFLDDLQKFLRPVVLLDDVGSAFPRPDQFQIGFQRLPGILLVLADVQVRLAADGPVLIVIRFQVVPGLGGKNISCPVVLQVDVRGQRLEHPGELIERNGGNQLLSVRQAVLQHGCPDWLFDAVHHDAAQERFVLFDMFAVSQQQDGKRQQVTVPVVYAADQLPDIRKGGRRVNQDSGQELPVFHGGDRLIRRADFPNGPVQRERHGCCTRAVADQQVILHPDPAPSFLFFPDEVCDLVALFV